MPANVDVPLKIHGSYVFLLVCAAVSVIPRLPFLHRISSWWRSSQTLLTSLWFQKEGISLLHPQLPVLGPPWQVPFEFPLYQASSVLFASISHLNLTASSRVVSVAWFYASAIMLFLLCREILHSRALTALVVLVYLWVPYDIVYSTEILIDFASVALALGYLYCLKKWMDTPRNLLWFSLAAVSGCLGAVVKVTTMAITIVPATLIALGGIKTWGIGLPQLTRLKGALAAIWKRKLPFLLLALVAILPVLSVSLWTNLADATKQANTFAAWLTSTRLTDWNYGTFLVRKPGLFMKTSATDWSTWLSNINKYFLMGGILSIFPVIGLVFLYRMPLRSRSFFGAALAGVPLTLFMFFNLYRHEYYYIAVSAFMSVLIGFGIYSLAQFLLPHKAWCFVFASIFALAILMVGVEQDASFQTEVQDAAHHTKTTIIPMARKVAAITPENKYVIAFQRDWYPDFMLYVERKGLVIFPGSESTYSCELISKHGYRTVVIVDWTPDAPRLAGILSCFKRVKLVRPDLYVVY